MQRGVWITSSIELRAPIAEGAMGRVWVAKDHDKGVDVAIKFLSDKLGDDQEEALARFEREAKVCAQIDSPHVVEVYENGYTSYDNVPYIVMEFLHGKTLGDRLRRVSRINLSEAITILDHTAAGLTEAHKLGIIHRDIKPDNIFMCRTDDGFLCKILDFGIAKQTRLPAMGGLTTDGKMVGTPEYMSPEMVLEDRSVDYRADLWSLAVVMYQALTGHLPFTGATLGQLCLNLVGSTPPKPTHFRPDLPPRVDAWFARALNRDAQMRFTSAQQMAESFALLEDELAFHTLPPLENTERHLSSAHTLRTSARKKNTMVTAAGVAAAVAVLGGGSWLVARPSEPLILAQHALEPMVNQVADRAVKNAPEERLPPPDESSERTDSEASPDAPAKQSTPLSRRSGPIPRSTPAPKPSVKPTKPKPAPPPASKRGRTVDNTGF